MEKRPDPDLPVHGQEPNPAEPSCAPSAYVSNEEAALVAAMRELREHAHGLRRELESASDDDARLRIESELAALRERWRELAARRETAYRRKMVMLGHLPPEALWE